VRAIVKIKDLIRLVLEGLTRQEFLISTRVHADSLYDDFRAGDTVTYRKICFLTTSGDDESVAITEENIQELATRICESEDLNQSLYENVLEPKEVSDVRDLELTVIKNVLRGVGNFETVNTRRLDFRDLRGFRSRLVS
jgi:hypothetical protein